MKKKKLSIEKFRVVKLEKPSEIFGGNMNESNLGRTLTETVVDDTDHPFKTIGY